MQVVHVADPPAAAPPQSNAGASPAPTSDSTVDLRGRPYQVAALSSSLYSSHTFPYQHCLHSDLRRIEFECLSQYHNPSEFIVTNSTTILSTGFPSTALWGLWDCFLTYFVTLPLKAATLTAICAILTALVFPSVYYWLVEVVLKILLRRTLADFVLKRPSGGGAEVDLTTVNGTMKVSAKVGPLGISLWNRGLVVPSIDIAVDILEIPKKDPAARRRKRSDSPPEDSGGAS
ncbi:Cyclin-dependent kinase 8, partial [Perkinsus olseni]